MAQQQSHYTPITDNESATVFLYALGFKLEHTEWQPSMHTPRQLACALRWMHPQLPITYCARHDSEWLATQIAQWMEEDSTLTLKHILHLLVMADFADRMAEEVNHVFNA